MLPTTVSEDCQRTLLGDTGALVPSLSTVTADNCAVAPASRLEGALIRSASITGGAVGEGDPAQAQHDISNAALINW
jgi:hypothetical protein